MRTNIHLIWPEEPALKDLSLSESIKLMVHQMNIHIINIIPIEWEKVNDKITITKKAIIIGGKF